MSALVSRTIGTWQPGTFTNITVDYSSRVKAYDNGSMWLSNLRLQDSGYYVVTVTDPTGSSKDVVFVLKVNGEYGSGPLCLSPMKADSLFLCLLVIETWVMSTSITCAGL